MREEIEKEEIKKILLIFCALHLEWMKLIHIGIVCGYKNLHIHKLRFEQNKIGKE